MSEHSLDNPAFNAVRTLPLTPRGKSLGTLIDKMS
jgi:hypothetical protein